MIKKRAPKSGLNAPSFLDFTRFLVAFFLTHIEQNSKWLFFIYSLHNKLLLRELYNYVTITKKCKIL